MPPQQTKKTKITAIIIVGALVIAAVIIWAVTQQREEPNVSAAGYGKKQGIIKSPTPVNDTEPQSEALEASEDDDAAVEPPEKLTPMTGEQRRQMELFPEADIPDDATLQQIVSAAKSWAPSLEGVYGMEAPDFALTDIQGNQHRLSDYEGSNVLIVYWATWCPYCRMEIPHLNLLQKRLPESELKVLAITNENRETVGKFAQDHKMAYTVLLDNGTLPRLYRAIPASGIPCTVFINPQGKIKLIGTGYMPLGDTLAVIRAEK